MPRKHAGEHELRERPRTRWGIILATIAAFVCLLIGSAAGYWQYVNSVPPFHPQLPPMPEPNGFTEAERLVTQLFDPTEPPNPWAPIPPEMLRAQLERIRPGLDRVRATFDLEWRYRPVIEGGMEQEHGPEFRSCAWAFAAESLLARRQGEYGAAMEHSLDAMDLGSRVVRGSGFLMWIYGNSSHLSGLDQAQQTVPSLPAACIPKALSRVRQAMNRWPPLCDMLANERSIGLTCNTQALRLISQQPLSSELETVKTWTHQDELWPNLRLLLTPRRTILLEVAHYYGELIAQSRRPARQWAPLPKPAVPWSGALIGPDPLGEPWRWSRMKTDLALLEVALAVRAYYLEHGRYPGRLAEISHRWLPKLPRDLWDQPIAYRLKHGQPVIYSLGPDGKDDRGLAIDPTAVTPTTRGDLVLGKLVRRARGK